jgi:hypothetical protein
MHYEDILYLMCPFAVKSGQLAGWPVGLGLLLTRNACFFFSSIEKSMHYSPNSFIIFYVRLFRLQAWPAPACQSAAI